MDKQEFFCTTSPELISFDYKRYKRDVETYKENQTIDEIKNEIENEINETIRRKPPRSCFILVFLTSSLK